MCHLGYQIAVSGFKKIAQPLRVLSDLVPLLLCWTLDSNCRTTTTLM
jgi:hypothetical protein